LSQDVRWARKLDPLSIDPLVAQALLTPNQADALSALRTAIHREPDSALLWFLLGKEQLARDDRPGAIAALRRAHRLAPFDHIIHDELARATSG
jgi:cytochrome c-type biogenesis protein CcmH/NrfG